MQPTNKFQNILIVALTAVLLLFCSCYKKGTEHNGYALTEQHADSAKQAFERSHHYGLNYNFVVKTDSLLLLKQQPEEVLSDLTADSLVIYKNTPLVVAEIRILPTDSIDSVWVQVARDQHSFGWIHESKLLSNVVPDDPISQFISVFSDIHLLLFLIVFSLISIYYIVRKLLSESIPLVHFKDIPSFYPTLFAMLVATSATFYAGIQQFAPDIWRGFYFHPTLNPFSLAFPLNVFLGLVWSILIVGIATIDEVRHLLSFTNGIRYVAGLAAICALNYIIFSISTLYYVGYVLLVAYLYFSVKRYIKHRKMKYVCGNCGTLLHEKTRCPHCGVVNK